MIAVAVCAVSIALAGAWLLVAHGKRRAQRDARIIGALIRPPRPVFGAQDDAVRLATERRRQAAEQLKRAGRRLDTRDDRRSQIHLVG